MKLFNTALGLAVSRFIGAPFYIRFHITHRCNYRCRMCGQDHRNDKNELSLQEIRIAAERLAHLKAYHIVITGGEPFLRQDLPDVIAIFRQHHFSIRVQTNGGPHVTPELLQECAQAGLQDLSVSIDTLNPELQDQICQGKHVTENAIRTLQLSRHVLPHGISQANVVASAFNFAELPEIVQFFYKHGVYTYITPVMIAIGDQIKDINYQFRSSDNRFRPEEMDIKLCHRVLDELIELRRHGIGLTNSTKYLKDYKAYLTSGQSNWQCEGGTLSLDILPDGGVSICKEKPPIMNILDHNFLDVIQSEDYRRQAKFIATSCQGCFYGEYREPQYAVREFAVLQEWVRDWFHTFRYGMRFRIDKTFNRKKKNNQALF